MQQTNLFKRLAVAIAAFSLFCASSFALAVPQITGRVNDRAGIMNRRDIGELEQYLENLEATTGIQMAVLTIKSLEGENDAAYALKVCEKWNIGRSKDDKGALLLVSYNDRTVRIEVGDGLEDKLTDTKCGLIIRNVIIPEFKDGDYSEGIVKGIKNMGGLASDNAELVSKSVTNEVESDGSIAGLIFMIIWCIVFISIITSRGGILKWIILSNMMGGSHRGGHYTHTNFGGGHSGGGFSGFGGGGGHFSGGGASGHW